jgi:hypothetical protein
VTILVVFLATVSVLFWRRPFRQRLLVVLIALAAGAGLSYSLRLAAVAGHLRAVPGS